MQFKDAVKLLAIQSWKEMSFNIKIEQIQEIFMIHGHFD